MLTLQLVYNNSTYNYNDIPLGEYYNQGYFAVCFGNIPKPFWLINTDSYLKFSKVGKTQDENGQWDGWFDDDAVKCVNNSGMVSFWQDVKSWGKYDDQYAYHISIPYNYTNHIGEFVGQEEYTSQIMPEYYLTENYVYILDSIVDEKANDTVLGSLTSTNSSAYPSAGRLEVGEVDYYCLYDKEIVNIGDWVRGDYIGDVITEDPTAYPADGKQDDYWYVYKGELDYQGDYIEDVIAYDYSTYPQNGRQGDYYYTLVQQREEYERGGYVSNITSTNRNDYPDDNKQNNYWYVYTGESVIPREGDFIEEVTSADSEAYPQNGVQGDYWYVYNKRENTYEKTFTNADLKGGVNYTHDLSTNTDMTIGLAVAAEVQFNVNMTYDDWYINQPCVYSVKYANTEEWKKIGVFNITEIVKKDKITCQFTGYDNLIKTDKIIDNYIKNLSFPRTLNSFYAGLINYLDLDYEKADIINATFMVDNNFDVVNLLGRDVLALIAEACGGYAYATPDGKIDIKSYGGNTTNLDSSQYAKCEYNVYSTSLIDQITIQQSDDDIGVSYPSTTGNNVYRIIGNPVLIADDLTTPLQNIYNQIKDITYIPAEITMYQDFNVDVGEYVNIDGRQHLILSKKITNTGVSLSSTGNQQRAVNNSLNSEILLLRGKSNKLIRDIDKTQSTITDLEKGLQSEILQTTEEINTRITNEVSGLESEISQTADSINTRITNEIEGVNSTIQQTADSLELKIEAASGNSSAIQVQLDQINTRITNEVDGLESTITQTANSINSTISGQDGRINSIEQTLDGVVYDNGSGTTVINGSNITTGTISADRINMTGSISWGDLTSDCQSTISSIGSSSSGLTTSDIKTLYGIQYTTIGQSSISSPTINSGVLNSAEINTGTLSSPKIFGGKLYVSTTEGDKYFMIGLNNYGNLQVGSPAGSYDDLTMYAENDIRLYPGGMFDDTNPTPGLRLRYDNFVYIDPVAIPNVANKSALYLNTESGLIGLSSSSRRYKRDIELVKEEWLDPNRLYDLDVVQFKWKEGHFADQDYDYSQYDIGLIAEDVAEKYPFAAIHKGDQVESWSERNIIPPMLYLIQEQKKMIDDLNKRIGELENGVN